MSGLYQQTLTEQVGQENHCQKKLAVARTGDGRYVWAIYSEQGFAIYRLCRQSEYAQKKIRKACREHGVDLPGKINWDELPRGQFIEKLDGEPEARIRDERVQDVRRVRDHDSVEGDAADEGAVPQLFGGQEAAGSGTGEGSGDAQAPYL